MSDFRRQRAQLVVPNIEYCELLEIADGRREFRQTASLQIERCQPGQLKDLVGDGPQLQIHQPEGNCAFRAAFGNVFLGVFRGSRHR